MTAYKPRRIRFLRMIEHAGWKLKLYSISHDNTTVDEGDFSAGISLALDALPSQAEAKERPGVGFVVAHRGAGVDYTVLAWWDRANELPLRVFVRDAGKEWRAARGGESVCVWDLQVVAFERDAFVQYMMTENPDVAAYLRATLRADAVEGMV